MKTDRQNSRLIVFAALLLFCCVLGVSSLSNTNGADNGKTLPQRINLVNTLLKKPGFTGNIQLTLKNSAHNVQSGASPFTIDSFFVSNTEEFSPDPRDFSPLLSNKKNYFRSIPHSIKYRLHISLYNQKRDQQIENAITFQHLKSYLRTPA